MPAIIAKKIAALVDVLNQPVVDVAQLKHYLSQGIPDEAPIIREYCWKIILDYLPEDTTKWPARVAKQTETYRSLIQMFLPEEKFPDYPLLMKKDHPRYQELEEDFFLWEQI